MKLLSIVLHEYILVVSYLFWFSGLVSMMILILSLILGLAANYPDQAKKIISVTPVWFKMLHNSLGLFAYGIGILSLCLGYYTKWFVFYTGSESRLVATVLTVFMSLWPLNGAFLSFYHQLKALITWHVNFHIIL